MIERYELGQTEAAALRSQTRHEIANLAKVAHGQA